MLGSVMVIGFPSFIWFTNNGITDPLDAITFPYRVPHKIVPSAGTVLDFAIITFSIIALDIPIALIGYTALSVLKTITFVTLFLIAASNTLAVPSTFVLTASNGKNSQEGTCFKAAA